MQSKILIEGRQEYVVAAALDHTVGRIRQHREILGLGWPSYVDHGDRRLQGIKTLDVGNLHGVDLLGPGPAKIGGHFEVCQSGVEPAQEAVLDAVEASVEGRCGAVVRNRDGKVVGLG